MAFFNGSAGVIYRQLSITIVSSMLLSVLVALIFTPALCATLLKPNHGGEPRRGFFGRFNALFERAQVRYGRQVSHIARRPGRALIVFAVIVAVIGIAYVRLPGGYLPNEDQGFMFVQVTAPPGTTSSHVESVLDQVTHYLLTDEAASVSGVFAVDGYSYGGTGQTSGLCFISLKPWEQRPGASHRVPQIGARVNRYFVCWQEAFVA